MLREIIRDALLEAHHVLQHALSKGLTKIEGRGGFGDYSRQFDILTEKAIIKSIKNRLNRAYIVSEEVGEVPCEDPEFYVLIDPVDGSTNASRGLPFYASSIAVAKSPKMDDVIAAGVINHQTGKIYLGDEESGVTVNGSPPSMSKQVSLKDALVFADLSSLKKEEEDGFNPRDWCTAIITKARHARFFAAASLEIAYILEGKADAFVCVSRDLKVMDFCASAVLVKWAGGEYRILGGKGDILLTENTRLGIIVASTNSLLEEILSLKR